MSLHKSLKSPTKCIQEYEILIVSPIIKVDNIVSIMNMLANNPTLLENGRVGFRKIGNSTRIRELGSGFTVQTVLGTSSNSSK